MSKTANAVITIKITRSFNFEDYNAKDTDQLLEAIETELEEQPDVIEFYLEEEFETKVEILDD